MIFVDPYPLWFLTPVLVFCLGMLLPLFAPGAGGARASHFLALFGCLIGVGAAVEALLNARVEQLNLPPVTPFATISLRLDPLASFFLLVISVVGAAVSLYAVGYFKGEHGALGWAAFAFNAFLATMMVVVLANSVFTFLFAWELMSLVSFFLVVHHKEANAVRRAGYVYLVMTHASTAFLLIAFLLLFAATGSFDFSSMRLSALGQGSGSLPDLTRDAVFLLALVAFGTKAGVIPFHVWLPRAHPAAPSHVSALMSGVMIKIAIYGLLRICWDIVGPGPTWWGAILLALGAISAVLGVLYALMEHDLKRLLAYHSVENIGIILIGAGAAFILASLGQAPAAALALLASLYHVLNHAAFKGLLFLGAGAIQRATRTRDMEALGGLIRKMPWTALTFLVGAVAISALPPLNGFVSEWLTFQALIGLGSSTTSPIWGIGAALSAGLLALTGGLAAFCFVKAFGITFLGLPRSNAVASATESNRPMLIGMAFLAVLCVGLGLLPTAVVRLIAPVTEALAGTVAEPSLGTLPTGTADHAGALAPLALFVFLLAGAGLALLLARTIGGQGRSRVSPPWCCGITLEPSMQYTATALAKPVRIIFRRVLQPYRQIERERVPGASYFVSAVHYESGIHPVYERFIYRPIIDGALVLAGKVRALQNGSLRTYLAYICVTLIFLLLVAR